MRRILLLALLVSLAPARILFAQDAPRLGIVMGYPASFGALWRVNGRVAIRPEMTLSRTSTHADGSAPYAPGVQITSETATLYWSAAAGASALLYMGDADGLRTYISPRFLYGRTSSQSSTDGTETITVTTSTYFVSGSFGAEYQLGPRFAVFGEVGVGLTRNNLTSGITTYQQDSHNIAVASRSGAGVIVYFGR